MWSHCNCYTASISPLKCIVLKPAVNPQQNPHVWVHSHLKSAPEIHNKSTLTVWTLSRINRSKKKKSLIVPWQNPHNWQRIYRGFRCEYTLTCGLCCRIGDLSECITLKGYDGFNKEKLLKCVMKCYTVASWFPRTPLAVMQYKPSSFTSIKICPGHAMITGFVTRVSATRPDNCTSVIFTWPGLICTHWTQIINVPIDLENLQGLI